MGNFDDLKYWVGFNQIANIGPVRFQKIIAYFKNPAEAWRANLMDLMAAGLEENIANEVIIRRSEINPEEELEKIIREDLKILKITDAEYPKLLKETFHPPTMLFYRGDLAGLNNFCLAVVGARKCTRYGEQAVNEIVGELARQGITIVSGLALGIDALAHNACLDNHGKTVAVIGSGLDWQSVYPSSNRYLAKKIIENGGGILTEYPIGMSGLKQNFPQRNRIISGLSLGVLVIEAAESSGALITAKFALEQNREVFAMPGSIFNYASVGANNLIKQGAKLVTKTSDILEELNLQQATDFIANQKLLPENKNEELILNVLSKEPLHIDKIAQISKLKINDLSATLTMMEMKGMIKNLGGQSYVIGR